MDGMRLSAAVVSLALLGYNGAGTACAREPGCLGKAPGFDCHLPGSLHLENGVGQGLVPDKRFIRGIVDDERLFFPCIVHPFPEAVL